MYAYIYLALLNSLLLSGRNLKKSHNILVVTKEIRTVFIRIEAAPSLVTALEY